jgi:polyisoprenoid-binding protein YceI
MVTPMTTDSPASTTTTALPLAPGRWALDPYHSTISFWVRHLGVSKVRGRFNSFDAAIDAGAGLEDLKVTATVDTASIDTGNADRDAHVRSADFLDVEVHPTMTLTSTRITGGGADWTMEADLTIAGVTRPVRFDVEFGGVGDMLGTPHAGFAVSGRVDRRDFGVRYVTVPGVDVALGDVVHFDLDLQFTPPAAG